MGFTLTPSAGKSSYLPGALLYDAAQTEPLSGTVNDLSVSSGDIVSAILINATALVTLNGLAGGVDNRQLELINQSQFTITIAANAGASLAVNRFANAATVASGATVQLVYNTTLGLWCVSSGAGGGGLTPGGNNVFTGSNEFDGAFLLNGVLTPPALASGTTDNYAPTGLSASNALRFTANVANSNLSGLLATGNGQYFLLINIGAGLLTFLHQNTGSSPANRFICPGGSDFTLVGDGTCTLWYDGASARYRLIV